MNPFDKWLSKNSSDSHIKIELLIAIIQMTDRRSAMDFRLRSNFTQIMDQRYQYEKYYDII